MRLRVDTFQAQKKGNAAEEYEDAHWTSWNGEKVPHSARFAVADGASEGSYSRQWASMLVRSFCSSQDVGLYDLILRARQEWKARQEAYVERRREAARPLQWFEEIKLEAGAFATLVGLELVGRRLSRRHGRWNAVAVGDSCLFHVRGQRLLRAFPVEESRDFTTAPDLIGSASTQDLSESSVQRTAGTWLHGDTFYLATDALAAWCLHSAEQDHAPWGELHALDPDVDRGFASWISRCRARGEVRNDDVTLVRVVV